MLSSSNILELSLEMTCLQGAINDTFYPWLNSVIGSVLLQYPFFIIIIFDIW